MTMMTKVTETTLISRNHHRHQEDQEGHRQQLQRITNFYLPWFNRYNDLHVRRI